MIERSLADAYKDLTLEFRPDSTVSESLDEVIAKGVKLFHLERMDKNAYWLGLDLADGRHVRVNFWTERATIRVNAEIEERDEPAPAVTSEEEWPACTCGAGSVGLGAHGVSCAFVKAKEAAWERSRKADI